MRFDGYDARAYDDEWTRPVDEPAYTTRPLRPAPVPGALRHLVFLDGRLLDVWVEPVEGSGYESWAEDLASRERRTVVVPAPQPPLPRCTRFR